MVAALVIPYGMQQEEFRQIVSSLQVLAPLSEIYVVALLAFNLFVSIARGKKQYPYSTKSTSMILHSR